MREAGVTLSLQAQCVLAGAKQPVGVDGLPGEFHRDQFELCGKVQKGEVADIAGQARMLCGIAQYQVLDDELDIDDAARVMFEIEQFTPVRVRVAHFSAHADDFPAQFAKVPLPAKDVDAHLFKCCAYVRIAANGARPGQRLMLPDPCLPELILAKRLDAADKQPGRTLGRKRKSVSYNTPAAVVLVSQVLMRWARRP